MKWKGPDHGREGVGGGRRKDHELAFRGCIPCCTPRAEGQGQGGRTVADGGEREVARDPGTEAPGPRPQPGPRGYVGGVCLGVCGWGGGELCPGGGTPPPSKEGGAAGQESPGVSALQQPFQFFLAVSGLGLYCLYIEEYSFGFWRGKKKLLVENI